MGKKADQVSEQSIAEAWDEELLRRLDLVKSGKAVLYDMDESLARMKATLRTANEQASGTGRGRKRGK